ncbi:MAG: hypothetical protein ACK5H1_00405 [Tenacibaculum sp.]
MPSKKYVDLKLRMGLMGLHYKVSLNNWLYAGAGMYTAITGDQGGLFALGIALGATQKLYKNLYLDANFNFGGGGGYRYLVNDGAYINPNVGLQYKAVNYSFGMQFSRFDFYSGQIKSNSLSFFVQIPSIFRFYNHSKAHQRFKHKNLTFDNLEKRTAKKNVQQLRFDFFQPIGNSKKDNGTKLSETLYALGFEFQKYTGEKTFLFIHTDAVYKGLRAGFMDLFFGVGYLAFQSKYFNLFGKLGLGAAGGRIEPEGGLTLYPSTGLDIKVSNKIVLSTHSGYYRAVAGNFEAYTWGFGLKYQSLNFKEATFNKYTYISKGISLGLENQSYFKVAKTDNLNAVLLVDLQLLALLYNYELNKNVYLTSEAGFAYAGKSGGYAQGLVGIGFASSYLAKNKVRVFISLTGGVAGGAGVDTGEGLIVKPTTGFDYILAQNFSIKTSVGKLYAPFGKVNSYNINIGISFSFATLNIIK